MLINGKPSSGDKPDRILQDVPIIEFEPAGLFGIKLAPGSIIATPEDFEDAATNIRASLSSDGDPHEDGLQAACLSNKHLNTDFIEVCHSSKPGEVSLLLTSLMLRLHRKLPNLTVSEVRSLKFEWSYSQIAAFGICNS